MLAMSRKAQSTLTLARGGRGAAAATPPSALFNDLAAAIACGAGYGAMHTVMAYGALLGTAVSNGAAFYWDACPALSAYVLSAGTAALYSVLHMALHVVAVEAWRRLADARRRRAKAAAGAAAAARPLGAIGSAGCGSERLAWALAAVPTLAHLAFALVTLLHASPACVAALPVLSVITAGAVAVAVWLVRQPDYTAARQVREFAAAAGHPQGEGEGTAPTNPAYHVASSTAGSPTGPKVTRRAAAAHKAN